MAGSRSPPTGKLAASFVPVPSSGRAVSPSALLLPLLVAARLGANLGTAADPLLAALVELLLPERHLVLEEVDRVLARGQCVLAMRRGDRDDDARLADLDATRAMVDRDLAEVVATLQICSDLAHDLLGHFLVRLVVEVKDDVSARLESGRAGERCDCAGLLRAHLVDDRIEGERFRGEPEGAARDGWDQGDFVAVGEWVISVGVLLVHRIEQAFGLVAELERGPDIADPIHSPHLALAPARALPETGEQLDEDAHDEQPSRRCAAHFRAAVPAESLARRSMRTVRSMAGDSHPVRPGQSAGGSSWPFSRRSS